MIKMLASVANIDEAQLVLDSNADIIDLKNPNQGALGNLELNEIRAIVNLVAHRKLISATIGDLPMQPELIKRRVKAVAETGVDIVKIGFFGDERHLVCAEALKPLADSGIKIVAVMFADQVVDLEFLEVLAKCKFYGVMLDTSIKAGKSLVECLSPDELMCFVTTANALGLITGLAGSLSASDIQTVADYKPNYMGFRGALCLNHERRSELDDVQLSHISDMLRKSNISLELAA
jgi:uncharacterized protein (UPF0264 family)